MKHTLFTLVLLAFAGFQSFAQNKIPIGGGPKDTAYNRGSMLIDGSMRLKGYVRAEKGIVITPVSDLGVGDFPGQIRVKPDGTIYVWNGSAWIPAGSGSTPVLGRTEFTIVSGANSATLTNSALANMTISRISYAGRTYNSSAFTKAYSSSSLTLSTAGASFYNGQVITITPDSLTGGSGGSGSNVAFYDDPGGELVTALSGADTFTFVSGAAWEGYADNIDMLLAVATNHYNRFVDAQRSASDGAAKPLLTQPVHDYSTESFRAFSGTDTFAVVIYNDWGAGNGADPRAASPWYTESSARKIQFTRINSSGAQAVYTPSTLPGGLLGGMRRLNER